MREVHSDLEVEPSLLPLSGEMLVQASVSEASGLIPETHFLTRGCFISTCRAVSPEAYISLPHFRE